MQIYGRFEGLRDYPRISLVFFYFSDSTIVLITIKRPFGEGIFWNFFQPLYWDSVGFVFKANQLPPHSEPTQK